MGQQDRVDRRHHPLTQHAIGEHALLADGRTAALVDPDGNVVWLCWPRIDSPPVLYSLLDEVAGGRFVVRPAARDAHVVDRRYHRGSLVLRTTWSVSGGLLHIDDALRWDRGPQLLRRCSAHGAQVDVDVDLQLAWSGGRLLHIDGSRYNGSAVTVRRSVTPGEDLMVTLGEEPATVAALTETIAAWDVLTRPAQTVALADAAVSVLGETACRDALRAAAAVLVGLRQRNGGIVAAPTTSLPQWPQSSRTWDYRYCWLRDASLAGIAMLRLGLTDAARGLGAFLGEMCLDEPRPLVRVDGSAAPAERAWPELAGWRRARPVRIGNGAAQQLQLDVPGEVLEFSSLLAATASLPDSLRAAVPRLAEWVIAAGDRPDSGIWEIRGEPRRYTHSRMMCWAALHTAASLARRGVVDGDASLWERRAMRIRDQLLHRAGDGPLELHEGGGGADAALAQAPLVGFLDPHDEWSRRLLRFIDERLDRNGLLDRHEPDADPSAEPCAPFVFPTFWMAKAQMAAGIDHTRHLQAAMQARGSLGLFGEVADPHDLTPLGNYPQVQSHAACVIALTNGKSSE